MSAPADCPADPFDRYGLQLVEEPARADPDPQPIAPVPRSRSGFNRFHWTLLASFGALQLAYLFGLFQIARWAVAQLTRS